MVGRASPPSLGGGDDAHRHECKLGGIFSGVWPDRPGYLEPAFHAALAALDPADIRREPAGWLKRWLKKCGRTYEQATPLAELRSAVVRLAEQAAAGTPIACCVDRQGATALAAFTAGVERRG